MLTEDEERICDRYSKVDSEGNVHCLECPLNLLGKNFDEKVACKATHHYNKTAKKWEMDP